MIMRRIREARRRQIQERMRERGGCHFTDDGNTLRTAEAYHVFATASVGRLITIKHRVVTAETKGDTHNSPTMTKDGLSE